MQKLILLGLPSAGKGTQGKYLASEFSLPHISIGDVVREHVNRGTELGKEIATRWRGEWKPLPDDIATEITKRTLSGLSGWILDGFPRNVSQAEMTDFLGHIDCVIHLAVSKRESHERIIGRARSTDAETAWQRRMAVEHERLPHLVEYMSSRFRLVEVDANPSEQIVSMSLLKFLKGGE